MSARDTTRPKRERLTRERVIRAAVEQADQDGLEGLNMRAVARRLNSGVMSLYSHVENKDALVAAMLESAATEIAVPAPDTPWREAIVEIALSAREALMRHPWAAPLWWSPVPAAAKLAHQESILRVLREAGHSVQSACLGYHAITMHFVGFSIQAQSVPMDATAMKTRAAWFLDNVDSGETPYFSEHVRHHHNHPEPGNEFIVVLNMILDGLSRYLDEEEA